MAKCLTITNVTVDAGASVTLTVPAQSFTDGACYEARICFDLRDSDATGAEYVYITDGETTYQVVDRIGDWLQVGRLRRRELLHLIFGNIGTEHFLCTNCLNCLVIKPQAAAAAEARGGVSNA